MTKRDIQEIKVLLYSGYKADEKPICFYHNGIKYAVTQIVDTYLEESLHDRVRRRYFRVVCDDSTIKLIHNDLGKNKWYVEAGKK